MRIGRYEFGLIKPLKWNKFWRTDKENPCGCTIWEFGFWYFTILRYQCAGEPDTRMPETDASRVTKKILANIERDMFTPPTVEFCGLDKQLRSQKKNKPRKRRKKKRK